MKAITVGSEKNILNPNSLTFDERQKQLEKEKQKKEEDDKKAKKSPFKNFIQINKDYYKAEDWLMAKSPIAYRIFKFLINHMDHYNAIICSHVVLQENFKVSRATVSRALKILKDKGYIVVFKTGKTNVYAVNDKIVWTSWGTNYEYSKFPANVILSTSEQENANVELKNIKHKEIILNTKKKENKNE